jgi:hypothetical protein
MKKLIALGATFAVLAVVAATSAAGGNPNTLTLAVYGDAPYWDTSPAAATFPKNAEFAATPAFIRTVNADASVEDVLHVGDIHSGSEACTQAYDQAVFDLWKAFSRPLIYTPGDNEWSDCTKTKQLNGTDIFGHGPDFNGAPLTHLGIVRSIFFASPGWSLGQHPMQVISQKNAFDPAFPADAQFVENVMWEQSKTLFVTVNVPGGSNNDTDTWNGVAKDQAAEDAERAARTAADIRWLDAAFAAAEADNAHSVVVIGQADMWDTADAPSHQTNYESIIKAIADNTTAYGKPVLYLNGDSHVYRSDNPLQQGSTCYTEAAACSADAWNQHPFYNVPNFHRIVVHGSTFPLEWLKLSIDPRAAWENKSTPTSWGPFTWQRNVQAQLTPTP